MIEELIKDINKLILINKDIVDGFIYCYETGLESDKCYDDLSALKSKFNLSYYKLVQLMLDDDLSYPYVVVIICGNSDFDRLDLFLCDNFISGSSDLYCLKGRFHEVFNESVGLIRSDF